jgi:hypothetical protein
MAYKTGEQVMVSVEQIDDPVVGPYMPSPDDLMGLTFVLDRCEGVTLGLASGQILSCDVLHDGAKTIVTVPWRPLVFPDLH